MAALLTRTRHFRTSIINHKTLELGHEGGVAAEHGNALLNSTKGHKNN